jgi:hypothetical protein
MKPTIYFFDQNRSAIMTISSEGIEPEHIAKFELAEGQSQFTPRYSLVDDALMDNFASQTDDEVAAALQKIEADKVAELAARLTAQNTAPVTPAV